MTEQTLEKYRFFKIKSDKNSSYFIHKSLHKKWMIQLQSNKMRLCFNFNGGTYFPSMHRFDTLKELTCLVYILTGQKLEL